MTFGRKKEVIGYFVLDTAKTYKAKRKLGILEGKAKVVFTDDFEMTEEEFLGL